MNLLPPLAQKFSRVSLAQIMLKNSSSPHVWSQVNQRFGDAQTDIKHELSKLGIWNCVRPPTMYDKRGGVIIHEDKQLIATIRNTLVMN